MARQYDLPKDDKPAPKSGGSEHYRRMRAPFAAELKDPQTRRLLAALVSAENPGAGPGVVESLMNRTAMVNETRAAKGQRPLSLKQMIMGDPSIGGGASFYGPIRDGRINRDLARVDRDPNYAARMNSYIDDALNGSNTIQGHTDQGSKGDPNYEKGGVGVNINGERFNDWGYAGSRQWREKNQAAAGEGMPAAPEAYGYASQAPTPAAGSQIQQDDAPDTTQVAATTPSGPDTGGFLASLQAGAKKDPEAISDIVKGLGQAATGTTQPNPYDTARPTVPIAPTPAQTQVVPMVDPNVVNQQRQQLAQAMQRLNSGRLY